MEDDGLMFQMDGVNLGLEAEGEGEGKKSENVSKKVKWADKVTSPNSTEDKESNNQEQITNPGGEDEKDELMFKMEIESQPKIVSKKDEKPQGDKDPVHNHTTPEPVDKIVEEEFHDTAKNANQKVVLTSDGEGEYTLVKDIYAEMQKLSFGSPGDPLSDKPRSGSYVGALSPNPKQYKTK
jgi:hypothetical protein